MWLWIICFLIFFFLEEYVKCCTRTSSSSSSTSRDQHAVTNLEVVRVTGCFSADTDRRAYDTTRYNTDRHVERISKGVLHGGSSGGGVGERSEWYKFDSMCREYTTIRITCDIDPISNVQIAISYLANVIDIARNKHKRNGVLFRSNAGFMFVLCLYCSRYSVVVVAFFSLRKAWFDCMHFKWLHYLRNRSIYARKHPSLDEMLYHCVYPLECIGTALALMQLMRSTV